MLESTPSSCCRSKVATSIPTLPEVVSSSHEALKPPESTPSRVTSCSDPGDLVAVLGFARGRESRPMDFSIGESRSLP